MIDIRRILCPIDFSDHSRRALDHAVAIARWYDSTITALHVLSPTPMLPYATSPVVFAPIELIPVDRDKVLADTKDFIAAEGAPGITIEAVVREGNAVAEILYQAAGMHADLLVMGTHGRSGFDRLLLGSVTEKVLRKTACPVLAVPRRLPDAVPAGPVIFKRILCPVDFSDSSLLALKYAKSMAQEADGRLTVLHVLSHEYETADMASIVYDGGMPIGDFQKKREDAVRRHLQEAVAGATEFSSVESTMTHGKPWREVLRVAAGLHSDLIVMGVHGRGAADLMLFGSTTQHVVREAPCPVLTLRHG